MTDQESKMIQQELMDLADPVIATHSQRFFKTGPGDYGEGDLFLGIRMPVIRSLVKKYKHTELRHILEILKSKYHEERMLALLLLVELYQSKNPDQKESVFNAYMANTRYINNWDLVDSSSYKIVGPWLDNKNRSILYRLAKSSDLWERRISIMSCLHFIKHSDFADALALSEILLYDKHDLMHKAVGWMLREVGNRDFSAECKFLNQHYHNMPRTMLRYAIEKFPEKTRLDYLKGKI